MVRYRCSASARAASASLRAGDLDEEPLEVRAHLAVGRLQRRRGVVHPDPAPVGVAHPVLLVERRPGRAGDARGGVDAFLVVGVHQVEPGSGSSRNIFAG